MRKRMMSRNSPAAMIWPRSAASMFLFSLVRGVGAGSGVPKGVLRVSGKHEQAAQHEGQALQADEQRRTPGASP